MWEEGTWSGTRVTRLSVLLVLVLVGLSAVVHGELGLVFDLGFVMLCAFAAMAVHPRDFFRVGVLPPLLLFGTCLVLAVVWRAGIANADDNLAQAVVSGLAHRSAALFTGYALALALLALRQRIIGRREPGRRVAQVRAPKPAQKPDRKPAQASKRAASPAPRRSTSGASPDRSTTVVGDDPHSPESITASST